jgi:integrase/recombinase XerC
VRRELADFLAYRRIERRLAPLTCSAYERDVRTCIDFLEGEEIATVGEVRRCTYGGSSPRSPCAGPRRRARRARSPRSSASSANEQIDQDPTLVLRTPKKRETLPDVLDRRALARLLEATELNDVWKRKRVAVQA